MQGLLRFVTHQPWTVSGLALLVTILAGTLLVDPYTGEFQLDIDPSANALLPENPFYENVRLVFGNDETVLIAYHAEDVFTRPHLSAIRNITERCALIDGVHHVVSLTNAQNVRGIEGGLETGALIDDEIPDDPAALAAIRAEALSSPIFRENWIFEEGRTGIVLIYLVANDRQYLRAGIDEQIEAIAHGEAAAGAEVWIAGQPHLKVAQYYSQRNELRRSLPLIAGALFLVLLVAFRTARGVLLPLLTVATSLVWTFAVAVLIGRPLNMITLFAPAVLAILGLSYAVHVVSEYYDELRHDPDRPTKQVMYAGILKIWESVGLTGLTTGAGFLAMLANPIPAIREVGLLLLIGTTFSVFNSIFVLPAMITLFGRPRRLPAGAAEGDRDLFDRFAERAAGLVLEHRRAVFVVSALVALGFLLAATRMEVVSDGIGSFSPDAQVRIDYEAVNEHLHGALAFNVVVNATYVDAFKEPENLLELQKLQEWLEAQPEIGNTGSIVDFITIMHRAFNDKEDSLRIPDTRRLIATLLFFGASDDTERFLDARNQMANITLRTTLRRSSDVDALAERIEVRLAELPAHLQARVTGNPILIQEMIDNIVWGQVISILLALVVIYVILWILFLSRRTGFRALLPNILPLLAFFGGLGLFSVPLSTATSLIAPMALGIAIDDTIHYFNRFQQDAKSFADERRATVLALRSVGRPMTYTTAALVLGFLMLTGSDLVNQAQFGAMAAFTLGFAWVVDFTLTPALCSGLRVVTLWDTLRVDLGEAPEESIPLFEGLSATQCRIVAHMASLRTVPAPTQLWDAGAEAGEMYVVIDGKIDVTLDTARGKQLLKTHVRGDTCGEVGLSHGQRTAAAEVVEDARLLRLTPRNMAEIARRRPKIASVLYRNLNLILAEIVARDTARLRA